MNNEYHRSYQKHYGKSYMVYLRRRWTKMARRVKESPGYLGLPICTLEDFMKWAEGSVYPTMFYAWKEAGHPLKLAPTVDRIRPDLGYTIENLQWLTYAANSKKGNLQRKTGSKYKGVKKAGNKWQANISVNGKKTYLGSFGTEYLAALCYLRHAKVVYAGLGLPPEAFELPTQPSQP